MKLLKNLVVLVMIFSLNACSSDEDSDQYVLNNTNLSAGSFDVNYLSFDDIETVNVNGLDIVTEISGTGETFQLSTTFFEDGNYITEGEYVLNYSVTVAGEVVTEMTSIEVVSEMGTYEVNDTSNRIILDGGDEFWDVTLFNANELRISISDMYTEEGVDYSETGEIRMVR